MSWPISVTVNNASFLVQKSPFAQVTSLLPFHQFCGIAFNVTVTESGIECRFHDRGTWPTFWWIFGKVFNTGMIINDYLNVTVSSPALQLKTLVIIKSSVISLCYYLHVVLFRFFFWMYRLKLKLYSWARFKWKVKPTLKV